MSNRQIQPVRPRDYQLARQVRPRSLWGQLWTIALQPGYFFRTLPPTSDSRQWFWVAILILGLVGLSAVRQEAIQNPSAGSQIPSIDFGSPPGTDLGGGSPFSSGGASVIVPGGGFPGDSSGGSEPATTTSSSDISSTLTTALIAASHILLGWFILALLLSEIPLFNGRSPSFSQNLQIAIWTTVPMGIMAGLQVIFYAAGGGVGEPGLSGLLSAWKSYDTLSTFPKSVILSLAIRVTLFWLWTLFLIYRGGRNALDGKRWAVMLVVVAWSIVLTITPVVLGTIAAEPTVETTNTPSGEPFPFDNTGLVDPSSQVDTLLQNSDGTLPTELQFLAQPGESTPEATSDPTEGLKPESIATPGS